MSQELFGVVTEGEELPQSHSIAPHVRLVGELLRGLQALWGKPAGSGGGEGRGEEGRGGERRGGEGRGGEGRALVFTLHEPVRQTDRQTSWRVMSPLTRRWARLCSGRLGSSSCHP